MSRPKETTCPAMSTPIPRKRAAAHRVTALALSWGALSWGALSWGALSWSAMAAAASPSSSAPDISGKYLDTDGDIIALEQDGSEIKLVPQMDASEVPPELAKQMGELVLAGEIEGSGKSFQVDTEYQGSMEFDGVHMDISIEWDARGEKKAAGLDMQSCAYAMTMTATVNGNEVADESKREDCSGLWKKQ